MIDETDISREKQYYNKQRALTVIKNLQKKHINGFYVPGRKEALAVVMDMIPPGALVARGDSMTVEQVGIIDDIIRRDRNRLIDVFHRRSEHSSTFKTEDVLSIERETFSADVFITGSNAITLDGKIVNVDGMGNRVAPMIFGPKKVILVLGTNKIVSGEEEARRRIRDIAAPLNAIRHYTKHRIEVLGKLPCVQTGRCVDCSSEARICRYTVIIDGEDALHAGRINVVLVDEELGI
ncbi:MAG: lactate utilization protein [Dehalococcoidales bacterium]|nr:lactate utilization protein [Dehalococcoidales bacterium]